MSSEHFQELLDEVEVGNSKFIKPHIVKDILKWLVRFSDAVEQIARDLDGVDLDEDSESVASDLGESKVSSVDAEYTDAELDAMHQAADRVLTSSQSRSTPQSQLPLQTLERVEKLGLSSLMDVVTLAPQQRTPLQESLLREYLPPGQRTIGRHSS